MRETSRSPSLMCLIVTLRLLMRWLRARLRRAPDAGAAAAASRASAAGWPQRSPAPPPRRSASWRAGRAGTARDRRPARVPPAASPTTGRARAKAVDTGGLLQQKGVAYGIHPAVGAD